MNFKLRSCKKTDYDFCFKLFEENMKPYSLKHWEEWNPNFFTTGFNIKNTTIIEVDNKPIGYFDIELKEDHGLINGIQLLKDYQNKGVGTQLLKKIETIFKSSNLNYSKLKVFNDNPVIKLYQKLNYKEIKETKDSIIMQKNLLNNQLKAQ